MTRAAPSLALTTVALCSAWLLGGVPVAHAGGGSCGSSASSSSSSSSGGGSSSSSSGGGSSSSSSGGSYGGSDDGGSSEPAEPACVDASPVVGIAGCRSFGDGWDATDRPRSMIEIEMGAWMLDGRDLDLPGVAVHEENRYDYAVDGSTVGKRPLAGMSFRFSRFVARHLYLGVGVGFARRSLSGVRRAGDLEVELDSARTRHLVGVGGVAFGFGRVVLRAEVEAGVRHVAIGLTTRHLECELDSSLTRWRGVAATRLVFDVFHRSRAAFGAYVGYDVVAREASAGARWSFHRRGFDALATD